MQTIDPAGALPGGYKGTRHTPGHSTGSAPASMRDSDIGTRERPTHTSRTERPRMFRFREKPRPCQTRAMRPRRSPSWTHAPEWRWEPQRTRIPCGSRDSASVCLCTANSGYWHHDILRRGSNQGNTQNEKSVYHQSSIDFRCYLESARFEPRPKKG